MWNRSEMTSSLVSWQAVCVVAGGVAACRGRLVNSSADGVYYGGRGG